MSRPTGQVKWRCSESCPAAEKDVIHAVMNDYIYTTLVQTLCVAWFLLDLCLTVAGEQFCVQTCNCSNVGDGSSPVWPEAVAGCAGAVAPVAIGGVAYGLKKLLSRSSGKLNISNPRQGLTQDYNRKGSLESSLGGYDNTKRRQSTLTMYDNDDEDFPSDDDFPRKSSVPSVMGDEGGNWSSTPRGVPMSRPSFLPASGNPNSWM